MTVTLRRVLGPTAYSACTTKAFEHWRAHKGGVQLEHHEDVYRVSVDAYGKAQRQVFDVVGELLWDGDDVMVAPVPDLPTIMATLEQGVNGFGWGSIQINSIALAPVS